ncbi:FadR/GntR family transcriptional regulator [Paenibacillus rigui]|uniref:GntR family transcriptional regulator n=1 Tax=Paenibacillus rigui TaxID=554312 RepID=A0A229UPU4_9BACL|nr:FadR/GntR family transcriptional regulator [Paenibacillus rigui]OXM85438.1 GntR family transcriptional regulator [Paenibacillus rigui]
MHSQATLQFEKVSPKKVSDFILEQLEEAIILKEFLSEEQLPTERELASMFNASRLAVREALSQLEEEGLIEKRLGAKGGTFVLPLTLNSHQRNREEIKNDWDNMLKVFEFRSVIEPEAACMAAERITPAELDQLKGFVEKSMEEDCTREMFRAMDVKFHLSIAKASGNQYFEKAVRQIRTKINPALDLMPYNPNVKLSSYQKHMVLLDALAERNGAKAKEIMKQHISETADAIYSRVITKDT